MQGTLTKSCKQRDYEDKTESIRFTLPDGLENHLAGGQALEGAANVKDPNDADDLEALEARITEGDQLEEDGGNLKPVRDSC